MRELDADLDKLSDDDLDADSEIDVDRVGVGGGVIVGVADVENVPLWVSVAEVL